MFRNTGSVFRCANGRLAIMELTEEARKSMAEIGTVTVKDGSMSVTVDVIGWGEDCIFSAIEPFLDKYYKPDENVMISVDVDKVYIYLRSGGYTLQLSTITDDIPF